MSLLLLIIRYKYFLIILIIIELVIINISIIIYIILGGRVGLNVILIFYLVFRVCERVNVCERVMGLIILVLIIRYYGDDYYRLFYLGKF